MPQAEFDAFDQLARRRGVKRSTLARQVLEDYLAEHLDELA
jgi:metal-responsive CopG/Arc/MetJ family transcriptional regulator